MTKDQLFEIGLTEEQADKALSFYTEEMKSLLPRARLSEETEKIAALQGQLNDRDQDIKTLTAAAGKGSEMEKQLSALQEKYEADTGALTRKISETKLNAALDTAILQERGRNPKAIKALIDVQKLNLEDDGELTGLDLAAVKASAPYLFETETVSIAGTGGAGGGAGFPYEGDPSQMSMAEYKAWRERKFK